MKATKTVMEVVKELQARFPKCKVEYHEYAPCENTVSVQWPVGVPVLFNADFYDAVNIYNQCNKDGNPGFNIYFDEDQPVIHFF